MAEGAFNWPEGIERTPPEERESYPHGFEVTQTKAFRSLKNELEKMDAGEIDIQTTVLHTQQEPWRPYKDRTPEDPAVVVRFVHPEGKRVEMAMDKWDNLRDNARALALTIKAKRSLTRYGVESLESEFETHALPSGNGDASEAAESGAKRLRSGHDQSHSLDAWQVLGVQPGADDPEIREAYRQLVRIHHPDVGGDRETYRRIQNAYEEMMGEEAPEGR